MLQSTPTKEEKDRPRVFKTTAELMTAWRTIIERRRRGEPDDTREIQSVERLQHMWNTWMQDWLDTEATDTHKQRRRSAQTSILAAWVHRYMGGKNFVMAVWQTGITWAPPPELLSSDINGALEHVAQHFASWTRRLARADTRHKRNPATTEAARAAASFGLSSSVTMTVRGTTMPRGMSISGEPLKTISQDCSLGPARTLLCRGLPGRPASRELRRQSCSAVTSTVL